MTLPVKLSLVEYNNPILSEVIEPFDFNNHPCDPEELSLKLIACMRDNKGYGLSANQCGLPYRVFAFNAEPAVVCFNPRIVDFSKECDSALEGCLSYPGLTAKIKRYKVIKVRYATYDGQIVTKQFQDLTARIFQHELGHLNGEVFYHAANFLHKDSAVRKWKKLLRQRKKTLV